MATAKIENEIQRIIEDAAFANYVAEKIRSHDPEKHPFCGLVIDDRFSCDKVAERANSIAQAAFRRALTGNTSPFIPNYGSRYWGRK